MDVVAVSFEDHALDIVLDAYLFILEGYFLLHERLGDGMESLLEEFELGRELLRVCAVEFIELVDSVAFGDAHVLG